MKQKYFLKGLRLAGMIIFALGGYLAYDFNNYLKEVRLVDIEVYQEIKNGENERVQMGFYDLKKGSDGETIKKHFSFLIDKKDLPKGTEVGDKLKYYFNEKEIDKSRIYHFLSEWEGMIIGSIGFAIFLLGFIPVLIARRRDRQEKGLGA